jgi:predicted amidophosphoribosyltransferase
VLRCPECQAAIVSLLAHGHCPACLFPLAAHYLAIDGETWLKTPKDSEQFGEIVRRFGVRLIYSLSWDGVAG